MAMSAGKKAPVLNMGDQDRKMACKRIKGSLHPMIIMYDLETCTLTGLPLLITFCIFDVFCNDYVDLKLKNKRMDHGIPVYFCYVLKDIYRIWGCMLKARNVSDVFLMAYNGNKFDHLYIMNGMKIEFGIQKGNNFIVCSFHAFGIRYTLRDLRDYITTGNLKDIGERLGVAKLTDMESLEYAIRDTCLIALAWKEIVCETFRWVVPFSKNIKITVPCCQPHE